VTGGSRGFGLATARALAKDGFSVGLVARSSSELADARERLTYEGAMVSIAPADVTDRVQVDAALDTVESELGPVVALINNAGSLSAVGPLWEVDSDEWWADVESSLRGALNLCHRLIPGMIERGEGRIVNISSYAGTRPSPYQSGYACGKAAMLALTDALAASLGDSGVKAFSVTPGFVVTHLTRHLMDSPEGRRWLPGVGQGCAVEPEVGARLVARVCSGEADALNGRFLHALDDLDELLRRLSEIEAGDLYASRVHRLSTRS
jgi:NAD(P)-dependent dehydrogenase (short-subunit alcohol dehydrogenase family)